MDIRYIKEQQKSYVVIKSEEDEIKVRYQKKMITNGGLKCIINENDRLIDGDLYNYYDITSKLSLSQLYGSRKLNYEDIKQLITSLGKACEEIDRYLLDISRILLNPDFIFYNYASLKFYFLYNVSAPVHENAIGYERFMDYLLEHVMPEDKLATDYIYQIYEFYEKGSLDIWDMVSMLPEESEQKEINDNIKNIPEQNQFSYGEEYTQVNVLPEPRNIDTIKTELPSKSLAPVVLMALGALGMTACGIIYAFMKLSSEEQTALLACVCSCGVLLIAGIFLLLREVRLNSKIKQENEELESYIQDELGALNNYGIGEVHVSDILVRNSRIENKEKQGVEKETQSECDDGKTVLFEPGSEDGTYKLFALDRKNRQHITIDRFPYTIGKMTGYVDCCIEHPSISRLHARIEKDEGRISIRDLNSLNGIYLNGMKMNPNEKRILEIGDEIKLGGLTYCLRFC